jgi:hypothetical protein
MKKEKSIKLAIKIWEKIVENPTYDKSEAIASIEGISRDILMDCPFCQYTSEVSGLGTMDCTLCPAKNLWLDRPGKYPDSATCAQEGSPYHAWLQETDSETKEVAANAVLEVCKSVLKEYHLGEK